MNGIQFIFGIIVIFMISLILIIAINAWKSIERLRIQANERIEYNIRTDAIARIEKANQGGG